MTYLGRIDHIDIVVEDPKEMADFLCSLGFTFVRKTERGGGGSYEVAFPGEGDQPILELNSRDIGSGTLRPLGLRHIAVRSSNMQDAYEQLSRKGFKFDTPPRKILETGRTLMNLYDPQGGTLQIVDDSPNE